MIASSAPLVLWAPSSQLLRDERCRVRPNEFVDYVEQGRVHVVAREQWLTSESFRNGHRWKDGAPWDPFVDGELLRILREDESGNEDEIRKRRVSIAPDETGYEVAERHLDENPEVAKRLADDFESRRSHELFPPGTLQAAKAEAGPISEVVTLLLKDAFNHGDAIAFAESDTAILLERQESEFLRYLTKTHSDAVDGKGTYAARERQQSAYAMGELSAQLLELLKTLETVGDPPSLREFVEGPGHSELVAWVRTLVERLAFEKPERLDEVLKKDLKERLSEGRAPRLGRLEASMLVGGTALSAIGLINGIDPLAIGGLGIDVISGGSEALKRTGILGRDISGPNWPFLYAFSGSATEGNRGNLVRALDL